jgi:DNA-binding Xre family transcriptional regulator
MFKNQIPKIAEQKGIQNAFQLSKALGVGPMTTARLWNGEFDRVDLVTFHRLCDLFQCQISEFLVWDGKKLGE